MAAKDRAKPALTWLITGCSSGFGLAVARLAQANGHRVIATSRDPRRTPELAEEVVAKGGEWLRLDQDEQDCGRVVDEVEARGLAIDVLVNCAAVGTAGPVESFSEAEVRRVMETNFFGPYRLLRAAAPYMRRRRSGVIVNLSSGAGMEARPSLGVYGASKSALDGLTKVLHKELQEFNVRVLLVYLGAFDTPMAKNVGSVAQPIDPDYRGTVTEKLFKILSTGDFEIRGDHLKAVRAIYDVVVGEGVGAGRESEIMPPLGTDMAARIEETQRRLTHAMEVFGDICVNVNVDDSAPLRD
ncbi:putative short-chain oxidoreductase [Durotheca rogersii]|uniref:putative short-chain oxidoreductase n=1 Tax=Durotheca rogersii TaxID=419775 RepID=UPI00221E8E62|nr:putative short-chain oxidoreductase [Durotheca rogersii]KAI5863705.1 putative short-chain oxidoreductase [Durotheca rogersii]